MSKFLTKYYKEYKDHDDEKFKFTTYPNIRKDMYVISNYGKVINFKTNQILKHEIRKGYHRIRLRGYDTNKAIRVFVHRLVCWEYCEHKEGYDIVNHIDANPGNNYYKNLEWTDIKGNVRHAIKLGKMKVQGTDNGNSKYTPEIVIDICEKLQEGYNANEIFKMFHPGKYEPYDPHLYSLIRRIRDGKAHKNVSSLYTFPKSSKAPAIQYWDKNDTDKITYMIKLGCKNKEIFDEFKNRDDISAQKLYDKIKYIRCRLKIYVNK